MKNGYNIPNPQPYNGTGVVYASLTHLLSVVPVSGSLVRMNAGSGVVSMLGLMEDGRTM